MQEILDEIAGIGLVVNFKCTEESLLKQHTRNGINSPGQEYLCMGKSGINLNLPSQDNPILSGADAGGCWKEKLRAYAEQVHFRIAFGTETIMQYANLRCFLWNLALQLVRSISSNNNFFS